MISERVELRRLKTPAFLLLYILRSHQQIKGYPPTVRDFQECLAALGHRTQDGGLVSTSTINFHLKSLQDRHFVLKDTGARALVLLKFPKNEAEFVQRDYPNKQ